MEAFWVVAYPAFSAQPELSGSQSTESFSDRDVSCPRDWGQCEGCGGGGDKATPGPHPEVQN